MSRVGSSEYTETKPIEGKSYAIQVPPMQIMEHPKTEKQARVLNRTLQKTDSLQSQSPGLCQVTEQASENLSIIIGGRGSSLKPRPSAQKDEGVVGDYDNMSQKSLMQPS